MRYDIDYGRRVAQMQIQTKTEEVCTLRIELKAVKEEMVTLTEERRRAVSHLELVEHSKGETETALSQRMDTATHKYQAEITDLKEQLQTKSQEVTPTTIAHHASPNLAQKIPFCGNFVASQNL